MRCQVQAGELAVCAELARTRGARSSCEVAGSRWPTPAQRPCRYGAAAGRRSPARIVLEGNDLQAARILSLSALTAGVAVTSQRNHCDFSETLLCLNGCDGPAGWRHTVAWHGQENHYRGPGDWLQIDGRPGGVNALSAWADEAASLDQPTALRTLAERR